MDNNRTAVILPVHDKTDMSRSNNAQIYLADQRSHTETNLIRQYQTLGPATQHESVGPLRLLSDDTLRAGAALTKRVEQTTAVVLLPITGGLEYITNGPPDFLEPGQTQTLYLGAGDSYTINNPYETETIDALQLWFSLASALPDARPAPVGFDMLRRNAALPLLSLPSVRGLIGRYDGRSEDTFGIGDANETVFAFVLTGVFEVANRLLHPRDGLSLTAQPGQVIEFESLSNDAVLLLLGMSAL